MSFHLNLSILVGWRKSREFKGAALLDRALCDQPHLVGHVMMVSMFYEWLYSVFRLLLTFKPKKKAFCFGGDQKRDERCGQNIQTSRSPSSSVENTCRTIDS